MSANIQLLTLSALLLGAFALEQAAKKLRIPSVIFLLASGMMIRIVSERLHFSLPLSDGLLPAIGTLGLILIVLEGALELELRKEKRQLIRKTLLTAVGGVIITAFGIAVFVHVGFHLTWGMSWATAVPFAVISSAVAIPSSSGLPAQSREFVIYESSFSDIAGVLLFSFVTSSYGLGLAGMALFTTNFVLTCLAAVLVSLGLIWYLDRVEHHVRFLPVLAAMVFLYSLAKYYHLSPLILILLFGLALRNPELYIRGPMQRLFRAHSMQNDLKHFQSVSAEAVFLVKSLFFLLFGFSIRWSDLMEMEYFLTAAALVLMILMIRFVVVVLLARAPWEILFYGPRGLITVLLFLGVPPLYSTPHMGSGVVTWVILMTILLMIPGGYSAGRSGRKHDAPAGFPPHEPGSR